MTPAGNASRLDSAGDKPAVDEHRPVGVQLRQQEGTSGRFPAARRRPGRTVLQQAVDAGIAPGLLAALRETELLQARRGLAAVLRQPGLVDAGRAATGFCARISR